MFTMNPFTNVAMSTPYHPLQAEEASALALSERAGGSRAESNKIGLRPWLETTAAFICSVTYEIYLTSAWRQQTD
jgi:hypothetical protein